MRGVDKFIRKGGLMPSPPKNLWEVLERGSIETYPIHGSLAVQQRLGRPDHAR